MSVTLDTHDPEQVRMMGEELIVVNEQDEVVGADSKLQCHLMEHINNGLLHRAFSVFLFSEIDGEQKLLLQQRASEKITFPEYWANTCCSHPLSCEAELEEAGAMGVKRAAVRKMGQELGIPAAELPLDNFQFMTRVHYRASSAPDETWGEHEIDHVLVFRAPPGGAVTLAPNANEVANTRWVTRAEFDDFVANAPAQGVRVSPWLGVISQSLLGNWWDNLDALAERADPETIHRLGFD